MSEETERLEVLIKERGLKNSDFKRQFGVSPQNYINWKNRGIPHNEILKLAEFFNVDANWLATGKKAKNKEAEEALKIVCDEKVELSGVKAGLLADVFSLIKLDIDLDDINMLHRVISNTKSRYSGHAHA